MFAFTIIGMLAGMASDVLSKMANFIQHGVQNILSDFPSDEEVCLFFIFHCKYT